MIVVADLPALVALLLIFSVLLLAIEYTARRALVTPELSRKLVHLGGGIVCLTFPFLIKSSLSVLALSTVMSLFFIVGRKLKFLRSLDQVGRHSRGSEYYPLAVWCVFAVTQGKPWLYIAALLVLAVADAGAALIGGRYGRHRYLVNEEWKSVEGSGVFLILALLGISIPLVTLSPVPPLKAILCGLLVSLIVTGIEAISRHGRDNLFVPLAVAIILGKITSKPLAEVIYQNVSFVLLSGFAVMSARHSHGLNAGGSIAIMLLLYAAWSLGSETWGLPIAGALALFIVRSKHNISNGWWQEPLKSAPVVRGVLVPFLLLVAANMTGEYEVYFGPFVASCIAVTVLFRGQRQALLCGAEILIAVCGPAFYVAGPRSVWACVVVVIALVGSIVYLRGVRPGEDRFKTLRAASASALLVIVAQWLGVPTWHETGVSWIQG